MSTIPTKLTPEGFERHVRPYLRTARRGYECKIPLYKLFNYILYWLHTGCQWSQLPIDADTCDADKKEISQDAVAYHFRKWSCDGSLQRVWQGSIVEVQEALNLSQLNLDGTQVIAKKGGESVAYQGRKKAKTCNILPIAEGHGYIVASTGIVAGNHHDAYHLKPHLQAAFKSLKRLGLDIRNACFNADSAFDTKDARKTCFNYGLRPNIKENQRNRQKPKRGRPRLFEAESYKRRFVAERSFAWIDKFKRLLIRFERKDSYFLGAHHIAFALVNLRHCLAKSFS